MNLGASLVVDVSELTAQGLCGVMEKALMAQGVSPMIAKQLAERACEPAVDRAVEKVTKPVQKKVNAYSRRYKREFKKIANKYKSKSGKWLKNGFKRAVKEAHRLAKK